MCFWQIDYMKRERAFKAFPLFRGVQIVLDTEDDNIEVDDDGGG